MDVAAAHLHVVKRPAAGADGVREHPHRSERNIEPKGSHKEPLASGLADVAAITKTCPPASRTQNSTPSPATRTGSFESGATNAACSGPAGWNSSSTGFSTRS